MIGSVLQSHWLAAEEAVPVSAFKAVQHTLSSEQQTQASAVSRDPATQTSRKGLG